jgi:CysZ protein
MTEPVTAPFEPVALGFGTGVRALFRGWSFLLRTPSSWPYASVPTLVLMSLLTLVAWVSARWVFPAFTSHVPQASNSLSHALWLGASGLATLLVFVLGVVLALALASPLSGPALEKLVRLEERALGVPARSDMSFWAEIWCGFRAQIFVLIWIVPVLCLLWLVELLLPVAAVATLPLKLVVTSFALAWNLLDYPLTLRGVRMRERFLLFKRFKMACLGFGATFALLFWIPCGCQIVLLPVGALAATDLIWRLLISDPKLLPGLKRPTLP